ncbi:MAG: VTC domain-containing protein, partial [Desertimonas sp.]
MSSAEAELWAATAPLTPIGLDEVMAMAALQTRIDRKYLIDPSTFSSLVEAFTATMSVLEIDGRRVFDYESIYFDTDDLVSYRRAAMSRDRRSFKVRTRTYLDSGECMVEVKCKSRRGETVKERRPHRPEHRAALDPAALAFVDGLVQIPDGSARLGPVLSTRYRR